MRRIFYTRFGGPDVLQLEHIPIPSPGPGQVRVRVAGIGVNPIDFKTRSGLGFVSQRLGQRFHFVPGYDVSGTVDALGDGADEWALNDPVFGMVNFPQGSGAYAEYVIAPATQWARAPASIPLAHAGGLPLAALTAWQALFDVGGLQAGERVLVLAGAGGVGHLAVQLAHWKGAQVSATASVANHEFLRRHGVTHALDYRDPATIEQLRPWDLILDLMGGAEGERALGWLAEKGRMVTVPTNTAAQLLEKGGVLGRSVLTIKVIPNTSQLKTLAALVDQHALRLHVSGAFALEEAASAHEHIEQGHVKGKLILVP